MTDYQKVPFEPGRVTADKVGRITIDMPNKDSVHGYIALRVSFREMEIITRRLKRHWLFWKRWHTVVLAQTPARIQSGDNIRMEGEVADDGTHTFTAFINDKRVLAWKPC